MALCLVCLLSGMWGEGTVHAQIASDNAFEGAKWEKIIEDPIEAGAGVVQSICATEHYIICIENTGDDTNAPDVIKAYYRNDVDELGNPVERYSLARRMADTDYEHANGMAYNPNTGEIAVALYTSNDWQNRGCIYLMDANTLTFKSRVQVSDHYNILGIGYDEGNDRYVIQTNDEDGYSFKILDNQFQLVEDLGQYQGTARGDNFQDLCVSGDYIINFPLTLFMGIGEYVNMYSISRRALVSESLLDFQFEGVVQDEPEGICELEPGVFAAVVNVNYEDGRRTACVYKTMVPYDIPLDMIDGGETAKDPLEDSGQGVGNDVENDVAAVENASPVPFEIGWKLVLLIVAAVVLVMAALTYWRLQAIRRERVRKLRQARRERERIRRIMEDYAEE